MSPTVITYLIYLAVSIGLCIWVGRTLFRGGRVFLIDVFKGNAELADSLNRLLIVGFYLINFGYVSLALKLSGGVKDAQSSIEALSVKIGMVLLVLGGMHFFNLYALSVVRRRVALRQAPPPLAPDELIGGRAPCAG